MHNHRLPSQLTRIFHSLLEWFQSVFRPLYKVGLEGARGTVLWTINRGIAMLKYTTVVMSVTAIVVNENGLVQFMGAMFGITSDDM